MVYIMGRFFFVFCADFRSAASFTYITLQARIHAQYKQRIVILVLD